MHGGEKNESEGHQSNAKINRWWTDDAVDEGKRLHAKFKCISTVIYCLEPCATVDQLWFNVWAVRWWLIYIHPSFKLEVVILFFFTIIFPVVTQIPHTAKPCVQTELNLFVFLRANCLQEGQSGCVSSCGRVSGRLVEELPCVGSTQLCLVFYLISPSFHSSISVYTSAHKAHRTPTSYWINKYCYCNWKWEMLIMVYGKSTDLAVLLLLNINISIFD